MGIDDHDHAVGQCGRGGGGAGKLQQGSGLFCGEHRSTVTMPMTDGSATENPPRLSPDVHPLGRSALVISWIRLTLDVVGLLVFGLVITVGLRLVGGPQIIWWPVPVLATVIAVVGLWWTPLEHRRWGWRLTDELFEVRSGVVVRTVAMVPRSRIQNVTTAAGPLQTQLGLVSLSVHTAGARTPNVSIRDLDAETAEWLRHQLRLLPHEQPPNEQPPHEQPPNEQR